MINLENLKKNYPYPAGFDRSALREYFQYKVLDGLFKSRLARKLCFLGGTAIKICYGSRRYSEDLDFDNFGLTKAEFSELAATVGKQLELEGYKIDLTTGFKRAFRAEIKISKVLQENKLSPFLNEKINIQIDTAPHGFEFSPDIFILQKFEVFRNIRVAPKDLILSQKAAAILGRKRAKGRDFYDLVYLMGLTDFNYDYLRQKLNIKNSHELKSAILKVCEQLDFKALTTDVLPFLINQEEEDYILGFRRYIEQKLK